MNYLFCTIPNQDTCAHCTFWNHAALKHGLRLPSTATSCMPQKQCPQEKPQMRASSPSSFRPLTVITLFPNLLKPNLSLLTLGLGENFPLPSTSNTFQNVALGRSTKLLDQQRSRRIKKIASHHVFVNKDFTFWSRSIVPEIHRSRLGTPWKSLKYGLTFFLVFCASNYR